VVIGDFNQAIYGFRGADDRFMKCFVDDFAGADVYGLTTSYRCSDTILQASQNILESQSSAPLLLKSLQKGVKLQLVHQRSDRSEAEFVARTIEKMIGGIHFFSMDSEVVQGDQVSDIHSLSDFAVLCRLRAQMPAVEKALCDHNIPHQLIGNSPFFHQEPIRSLIDLFKLSINPDNSLLHEKLVKRGFADAQQELSQQDVDETLSAYARINILIDHFFQSQKREHETMFQRFLEHAREFDHDLKGFLELISLGCGADTYRAQAENVTVMTMHAAKGLEFKCVFLVGCEQGILPYTLFETQKTDLAEEQRLLYVAMTRAQKYLFLTHSDHRTLFGREYKLPRSEFLASIEQDLFEMQRSEFRKKKKHMDQLSLFKNLT